jgi:hypothetical protein
MARIIRTTAFLAWMAGFPSSPVLFAQEPKPPAENAKPYTAFPDIKLPSTDFLDLRLPDTKVQENRAAMNALVIAGIPIELPMNHTPLQKVQYEQVREGLQFYLRLQRLMDHGFWNPSQTELCMNLMDRVYEVAAQLAPGQKDNVRCYVARVLVFKELERFFERRVDDGSSLSFELDLVRFRRLGAEAALMSLTGGAPLPAPEPKPMPAKAADPIPDDTPAYTAFPKLKLPEPIFDYYEKMNELVIKDILRDLPKDHTLLDRVRYEHVRAGLASVNKMQTMIETGKWNVDACFMKHLKIASQVYPAAAKLEPTAEGKIHCYEACVLVLKEIEAITEARVGGPPSSYLDAVHFYRLQAEANLLRLKDELGQHTDKKAGIVEAKSPQQKLDPSAFTDSAFPRLIPVKEKDLEPYLRTVAAPIFKETAVNLPKKPSALERIRFEQAQEGFRAIDKMIKLIDQGGNPTDGGGRVGPLYFWLYSNAFGSTYMVAAELQPTKKGKLRCYEAQLVFANLMEKLISDHAKVKVDPTQESDSVRFLRLEAEAQLLKVMDLLGEGKLP